MEAWEREEGVRKWDWVRLVSGDLGWSTAGKDRRRYRVPGVRKWNWVRLVLRANQAPGAHGAIENKQLLGSFGSGVGEAAAGGAAPRSPLNPVWTWVVRLVMRSCVILPLSGWHGAGMESEIGVRQAIGKTGGCFWKVCVIDEGFLSFAAEESEGRWN